MQKKLLFLFFFLLLLGGVISVFGLGEYYKYDYANTEQKIKLNSDFSGGYDYAVSLNHEANSWIIAIPKSQEPEGIKILWDIGGRSYERALDIEDTDDTTAYYSFPLVTELATDIRIRIITQVGGLEPELIAMNTLEKKYHLSGYMPRVFGADQFPIVSRAEWGADESLRYRDQASVDKKIEEWKARGKKPKEVSISSKSQEASKKEAAIGKILKDLHPDSFSVVSKIRYENGNKLIWPITKSKSVDRIVLHHTAETLEQASKDDMAIMRAIYAYHARTRGWGDIGYNYVVGHDGTVYEGRAGGDYVEGAHAYANNLGTVGVSVMGNFETETLNNMQRVGLENLLVSLAKKYGINLLEDTTGFRTCDTNKDPKCTIDIRYVKRLHAHRDVGHTSCPGKNLYALIDDIRNTVGMKVGKVIPIYNTQKIHIDPVPEEDKVTYILDDSVEEKSYLPNDIDKPTRSLGGSRIRIKLSYPTSEKIDISVPTTDKAIVKINSRVLSNRDNKNINVGIVGNNQLSIKIGGKLYTGKQLEYSAPVVRIDSWTRIPSWDTTKKYNDNLFRSRIIIRNEGGKLLVINELPLEDYLRGLGEVSNSDNPEKIKTITVAARSYARYYMERANRKYGTNLYDGSDNPDSFQRYLGYSYELRSPNVSREVKNTLGQVITYKGKIVKAWYFSSSAGRTLSYKEYCEKNTGKTCSDIPYLQSVSDPAGEGKTQLGHGVGISGIGATAMAEAGKTYKEIIQYYMNGVEIQKK